MKPLGLSVERRVTTGRNRDDGRSYFAGFLLRQQRIGTRGHLICSRRVLLIMRGRNGNALDNIGRGPTSRSPPTSNAIPAPKVRRAKPN